MSTHKIVGITWLDLMRCRLARWVLGLRYDFVLQEPAAWVETRLTPLCRQLEVLRAKLGGRAVTVISGYRGPEYNRRVGGARASQHLQGRAADIQVEGVAPAEVHRVALGLYELGELEIGGLGLYSSFVHLDVRGGPLKRWGG